LRGAVGRDKNDRFWRVSKIRRADKVSFSVASK
jgi:hypothetical protein